MFLTFFKALDLLSVKMDADTKRNFTAHSTAYLKQQQKRNNNHFSLKFAKPSQNPMYFWKTLCSKSEKKVILENKSSQIPPSSPATPLHPTVPLPL